MMSSNLASAEAGGYPDQQQNTDDRWVTRYSGWLSTMGAIALVIVGALGAALNVIFLSPISAIANVLQVVAAAIILAIEGSSAVAFLSFAKPIGVFFEGKPVIVRALLYGILTVVPMLFSPSALGYLGFLISAGITAVYASIVIGKKGSVDDMRAAAVGGGDIPKI